MTKFYDECMALPKGEYYSLKDAGIKPSQTKLLDVSGVGVTNATSTTPCLGTVALDVCTGLALYNKKTKTLCVTHLHHISPNQFTELLTKVRSNDSDMVECHIIGIRDFEGSQAETTTMLDNLCNAISASKNITVKTFDVKDKAHPTAFIVDARNGRLIRGSADINPAMPEEEHLDNIGKNHLADFKVVETFDGTLTKNQVKKSAKR